ncbi:MAG TPA: hypothetical protein VFA89_21030 [Terriglobales bacterium]|nr:hypothetical protein [Terriglobales bacterium]
MHQVIERTKAVRLLHALQETINDAIAYDGATNGDIVRAVMALANAERKLFANTPGNYELPEAD